MNALTHTQYRVLARLRNNLSIGGYAHGNTINSLRQRGLLDQYSLDVTKKGHAVMDTYGENGVGA